MRIAEVRLNLKEGARRNSVAPHVQAHVCVMCMAMSFSILVDEKVSSDYLLSPTQV